MNTVFVAMSFDSRFDHRWAKVIKPAIESVQLDGEALSAFRVDAKKISDAIVTTILDGIRQSRLIFADITALAGSGGAVVRNGNVMYELGIAHAVRLPEEVVVFRSDTERLLFDIQSVRVNQYDPDNDPQAARDAVVAALEDAVKSIALEKHLAVQRAVEALDANCLGALSDSGADGTIPHPKFESMMDLMMNPEKFSAIFKLIEMGVIETVYPKVASPEEFAQLMTSPARNVVRYRLTTFGQAVIRAMTTKMGANNPEFAAYLNAAMERFNGSQQK